MAHACVAPRPISACKPQGERSTKDGNPNALRQGLTTAAKGPKPCLNGRSEKTCASHRSGR